MFLSQWNHLQSICHTWAHHCSMESAFSPIRYLSVTEGSYLLPSIPPGFSPSTFSIRAIIYLYSKFKVRKWHYLGDLNILQCDIFLLCIFSNSLQVFNLLFDLHASFFQNLPPIFQSLFSLILWHNTSSSATIIFQGAFLSIFFFTIFSTLQTEIGLMQFICHAKSLVTAICELNNMLSPLALGHKPFKGQ